MMRTLTCNNDDFKSLIKLNQPKIENKESYSLTRSQT